MKSRSETSGQNGLFRGVRSQQEKRAMMPETLQLFVDTHRLRFRLTDHFVRQCNTRQLLSQPPSTPTLQRVFRSSVVIRSRPTRLQALLNNRCRDAIYLYHSMEDMVIVLEQHDRSRRFELVKTAYRGAHSKWLHQWLRQHSQEQQPLFLDFFREYDQRLQPRLCSSRF